MATEMVMLIMRMMIMIMMMMMMMMMILCVSFSPHQNLVYGMRLKAYGAEETCT